MQHSFEIPAHNKLRERIFVPYPPAALATPSTIAAAMNSIFAVFSCFIGQTRCSFVPPAFSFESRLTGHQEYHMTWGWLAQPRHKLASFNGALNALLTPEFEFRDG